MRPRSTWLCGAIVVLVTLVATLTWVMHRLSGPPPNPTIGRDTTWLDGPLDADGRVDYDAAWRRDHGAGVTAQNNGAPLVFAAAGLGVQRFTAEERAALPRIAKPYVPLRTWGPDHPQSFAPGVTDYDAWLSTAFDEADLDGPASVAMEDWFEEIDVSLDFAREASMKPRFYVPDGGGPARGLDFEISERLTSMSRALSWRALRHAWQDSKSQWWTDLEAALRLASLERSLDVKEYVNVACESELDAWTLARGLAKIGSGISSAELARLQAIDAVTLEERLRRFLPAVRIEALQDFQTSLRDSNPSHERSSGPLEQLRRLLTRQIDPDPGCRRINASCDEIEAVLFSTSPWNERVAAFRADLRRREAELLQRLAHDALLPSSGASSEKIADAIFVGNAYGAEPEIVGLVRCIVEADLVVVELGADCYARSTGNDPATSDDLTPLVFERPFRDRLLGSTVVFARDEHGRIVARGALADFESQLDLVDPDAITGTTPSGAPR